MNTEASNPSTEIAIVQRLMFEVLGQGMVSLLPELISPTYVGHFMTGDHYGPEGARIDIASYRSAFPDLTVRLDDIFACHDKVVRRFTLKGTQARPFLGKPSTGQPIVVKGIGIDRVTSTQLQESWVLIDVIARTSAHGA